MTKNAEKAAVAAARISQQRGHSFGPASWSSSTGPMHVLVSREAIVLDQLRGAQVQAPCMY